MVLAIPTDVYRSGMGTTCAHISYINGNGWGYGDMLDSTGADYGYGPGDTHGDGWGWEGVSLKLDEWIDTATNTTINTAGFDVMVC